MRAQFGLRGANSSAMWSRLYSNASRSINSAGVSISSSRIPGRTGGGCNMLHSLHERRVASAQSMRARQSCRSASSPQPASVDTPSPHRPTIGPRLEPIRSAVSRLHGHHAGGSGSDSDRHAWELGAILSASLPRHAPASQLVRRVLPACPDHAMSRTGTAALADEASVSTRTYTRSVHCP